MNEVLRVTNVEKNGDSIMFTYEASDGLKKYLSGQPLFCKYNKRIVDVPNGIAVIPFLADVLPFIWLTDSTVEVDEIDKDFYECVGDVREGYKEMYPMLNWGGVFEGCKNCRY